MFSVAFIGPDGAGKTTISRRLEQLLPLPVKYLYMGGSRGSSNHMLPTTRLIEIIKRLRGRKPVEAAAERGIDHARHSRGGVKRAAASLGMSLSLVNQICEEWYRQGLSWYYQFRGHIVIFDRHFFFDYHSYDAVRSNQEQPLRRGVHLFIMDRLYPKPDLVIYLDAPADVLFTRKGEGTLTRLENQRQGFLQMRGKFRNFFVLDASQPEGDVARVASDLIRGFYLARIGIKTPGYSGTTKEDSRYL
jgi:thymidylate kinase